LATLTKTGVATVLKVKLMLHSSKFVQVVQKFDVLDDHALALGLVVLARGFHFLLESDVF
jgi:hypothetical protein